MAHVVSSNFVGSKSTVQGTDFICMMQCGLLPLYMALPGGRPNAFTSMSWVIHRQKTLRDELFDVISAVPDLYHQYDQFCAQRTALKSNSASGGPSHYVEHGVDLLRRYVSLSERLLAWETKAVSLCEQKQPLDANTDQAVSSSNAATDGARLIDMCTRHGDGFFFICAQYWASCVKVYTTARLLHQQILALIATHNTAVHTVDFAAWIDPEPPAHHIASIVPHFFRPGAGLWSAQSAVFPISTALFYFAKSGRRDSRVFMKITDAFSENKTGAIVRDFIQNIVNSK